MRVEDYLSQNGMLDYAGDFPDELQKYSTMYPAVEVVGWKFWDTQTFTAATTTSLPGYFDRRATVDLSNMVTPFQFSYPSLYFIKAIRMFVKQRARATSPTTTGNQTGAVDTIAQIINTGVFTLNIGSKPYMQEPLWALTAGGGAAGMMAATGNFSGGALYDYAQNGIADPRAVNSLPKPLLVPTGMPVVGAAFWPAALTTITQATVDITFCLDGDLYRPVQ